MLSVNSGNEANRGDESSRKSVDLKVMEFSEPLRLSSFVQPYHWGKSGEDSLVARIAGKESEGTPCAELWVGAHPGLPSEVHLGDKRVKLNDLIAEHPQEILGEGVLRKFGNTLPYLFKILSVGMPLSIQAHPDKALAKMLHAEKGYPDDNHKPELAIALSNLTLLYGFLPMSVVRDHFTRVPVMQEVVGESLSAKLLSASGDISEQDLRKELYRAVLTVKDDEVERHTQKLLSRLKESGQATPHDEWVVKLIEEHYPKGDVGIFSFYLMNLETIPKGQAVFIGPNIAHAYLDGDLAECMANSDNVVRAGLTPKPKDVETLLEMLSYEALPPLVLSPQVEEHQVKTLQYSIPEEAAKAIPTGAEFEVTVIEGDIGTQEFSTGNTPQILFCLEGRAKIGSGSFQGQLDKGDSYLIPSVVDRFSVDLESARLFLVSVP